MQNLVSNITDKSLLNGIKDFKISQIFFVDGEINIRSEYTLPDGWSQAYENALQPWA